MIKNKVEFEVDGAKYAVVKPTAAQRFRADVVEAKALKEAVTGGAVLRERVADELKAQGLLDDAKVKQIDEIQQRLAANARRVPDEAGRVREKGVTPDQARDAAVRMAADRYLLRVLNADRIALEAKTVEGLAENAKFEYLVSVCALTERGEPAFASLEDYQDRVERNDPVAVRAANLFAFLSRNLDPDFEKNLPENKYLEKIGYWKPAAGAPAEETFALEDPAPAPVDPAA